MESKVIGRKVPKGQGLMEYALILVLVVLVVIVALALLGPTIGRTYSNVVQGIGGDAHPTSIAGGPTAVPTPDPWVFCAVENAQCVFSGTKHVRFGKNGTYIEKTFTDGTPCTVTAFGSNPVIGVIKECIFLP